MFNPKGCYILKALERDTSICVPGKRLIFDRGVFAQAALTAGFLETGFLVVVAGFFGAAAWERMIC